MRDMLFVSHANEDNEFTRWIALQLANEGYGVWCDLTKLLGGERFWDDIQDAIHNRTAKFLFVLSKTSNGAKESPKDELELALKVRGTEKLGDFVIPLWIDDLIPSDFYVRLQNLNAIRFQGGWRSGLDALLTKLAKDRIPMRQEFGPAAVRSWWRTYRSPTFAVRDTPETLLTNWHAATVPACYLHSLERVDQALPGSLELPSTLPYPGVSHNQYLVSLAPAEDFSPHLGPVRIFSTRRVTLDSQEGEAGQLWTRKERSAVLTQLLNQAWQRMLSQKGLPTFAFSNGQPAFYFKLGTAAENKVEYFDAVGKRHWRNVVGTATQGTHPDGTPRLRYWHFGLQARAVVTPRLAYLIKPHVLFSDDGLTIWESSPRLHRARRSQCKLWWNDKWRDLLLGTMAWLAGGEAVIRLPISHEATLPVSAIPLSFTSPFSYDEAELDRLLNPDEVDVVQDIEEDLEDDSDEDTELADGE